MIDWKRWLPGMPDDETEDPVSKALRALGQAAPAQADIFSPHEGNPAVAAAPPASIVDTRAADEGPWEQPYPGTVTPIRNPDGSVTTERSITVTEPDVNQGQATNIPTVWSGRVVPDEDAITNASYAGQGRFPSYPSIDEAVTAAEQRSRDLGAGQATSIGGAEVPPDVIAGPPRRATVTPVSGWEAQKPIPGTSALDLEVPRRAYEAASPYLQPAGGAPEMGARLREINDQAAREQGRAPTDVRAMFTAAEDPTWRAQNPELAAEYDQTQQQYGLNVVGQAGDSPAVLGRAGAALRGAAQQGAEAVSAPVQRAVSGIRAALGANAENVAAADARMAAEGSTVAPGVFGEVPPERWGTPSEQALRSDVGARYPDITRDVQGTVRQTLGEPSAEMLADSRYPRDVVHPDLRAAGIGPEITPQIDLSDRLNAGFGTVPESGGGGRRWVPDARYQGGGFWHTPAARVPEDLRSAQREVIIRNADHLGAVQTRETLEAELRRAPDDPELQRDLMSAIAAEERARDAVDAAREWHQMVTTGDRTLATSGVAPETGPAPDRLAAVNRVLGQGVASTFSGGTAAAAADQLGDPDDPNRQAKAFVAGALAPPLIGRGARGLARLAGAGEARGAEGALAAFGAAPGAGGAPQPGPGFFARFPGVQQAITASQARAAAMAARGQQPLGPLAWTGRFLESVGHSSMLGIQSATTNLIGNVAEPIWSLPKEPARAVQRAIERGNPSALREPGEMALGAAHGLWNAGGEMVDALAARGRYYSPDQPMLSQQTVNPFSHALATAAELGGRVVLAIPDALFGSIARGAGEHREASQIATNAGLRGQPWKDRVSQILADRDAIMAGAPPADAARLADAQQSIKAGGLYAKDQTYQNELGDIGKGARGLARLGDAPVVGKLVTPYFNTPWNAKLRLGERTPLGLAMNTTNRPGTMRTRFDKYYDAAAGSALIAGLVGGPAASGRITGSGPDDEGQRALMRENGWLPQSTLVRGQDGQDYYVQNSKIPIFGPLLNVVGEIHDAAAYGKKDATSEQQIVGAARRFGKLFQSEAQLQGISDLLGALTDPAKNLRGYAGDLATRVTPYAATIRNISTSQDTQERQADRGPQVSMGEEILGRWQQGTGQRSELPVREGLRGPEENPSPGIWAFFPKASKARNDPVVQTFLNANVDIPRERTTVTVDNKIPAAQRPAGQPSSYQVPLTPAQTRLWENARNRELVRLTETALRDPRWEQMAPGAQQQLLQGYVGASARVADTSILTRPEMQAVTAQAIREQQSKAAEQYRTGTR